MSDVLTNANVAETERLIGAINDIHLRFSRDYFETGKIEKHNLLKTTVPTDHILRYRLTLHESINDYLIQLHLNEIEYYYRVKTSESILDKIARYAGRTDHYPVNNWLNDIFGARKILCGGDMAAVMARLDDWRERYGLKNWYLRDKEGYKGLHVYFKNRSNFYFPWELQLWDEADVSANIENHMLHKRNFVDLLK